MCRIAFTIDAAAKATGLDVAELHLAVREGHLIARTVPGRVENKPVVISDDLAAWIATFERWSY